MGMHEGRGGGTFSNVHSIKLVANLRRETREKRASAVTAGSGLGFWEQHRAGTEVPLDWHGSLHGCSVPGNAPPVLLLCLPASNGPGILQSCYCWLFPWAALCMAELHHRYPRLQRGNGLGTGSEIGTAASWGPFPKAVHRNADLSV